MITCSWQKIPDGYQCTNPGCGAIRGKPVTRRCDVHLMPKYCKPNTKGRCRYCGVTNRTSQDRCNPDTSGRASSGPGAKASRYHNKSKSIRTELEQLELVVTYCSTCEEFQDADSFENLKCRKVGSCRCLWNRLSSALFGCPNKLFDKQDTLIDMYKELDK